MMILGVKSPLFLNWTDRKDSRMMGNHVWKFPNALLFIHSGNMKSLYTNGCGYFSTQKVMMNIS